MACPDVRGKGNKKVGMGIGGSAGDNSLWVPLCRCGGDREWVVLGVGVGVEGCTRSYAIIQYLCLSNGSRAVHAVHYMYSTGDHPPSTAQRSTRRGKDGAAAFWGALGGQQ